MLLRDMMIAVEPVEATCITGLFADWSSCNAESCRRVLVDRDRAGCRPRRHQGCGDRQLLQREHSLVYRRVRCKDRELSARRTKSPLRPSWVSQDGHVPLRLRVTPGALLRS